MNQRLWQFAGGASGQFEVHSVRAIIGEGLPSVARLAVTNGESRSEAEPLFCLKGVTSNERYLTGSEKTELLAVQQPMGRPACLRGALIPIKKSQAWWDLPQDERRAIFETRSAHIQIGRRALPSVARRLHHCRDLGGSEPFDFLTWFDFSAEDEPRFDDLLAALRDTEEWRYVEREVEIRVSR
ncbi:MAG TPA: chlorite dismutase family protein [Polyangiaceae bacterium]|nr:chlorite dismutase family protein [Polyangiaceae bacterium]